MPLRPSPNATAPEARCQRPVRVMSKAGVRCDDGRTRCTAGRRADPKAMVAQASQPRSAVNVRGLLIAIAVLFAGLLPVLVDRRRRGLYDMLAGTVVESTEPG
jgi:hypothetical protein